jgi:hypothetical protein
MGKFNRLYSKFQRSCENNGKNAGPLFLFRNYYSRASNSADQVGRNTNGSTSVLLITEREREK